MCPLPRVGSYISIIQLTKRSRSLHMDGVREVNASARRKILRAGFSWAGSSPQARKFGVLQRKTRFFVPTPGFSLAELGLRKPKPRWMRREATEQGDGRSEGPTFGRVWRARQPPSRLGPAGGRQYKRYLERLQDQCNSKIFRLRIRSKIRAH